MESDLRSYPDKHCVMGRVGLVFLATDVWEEGGRAAEFKAGASSIRPSLPSALSPHCGTVLPPEPHQGFLAARGCYWDLSFLPPALDIWGGGVWGS